MEAGLWEKCTRSPLATFAFIKRKGIFVDDEIARRLDYPLDPAAQTLIRELLASNWVVYDHLVVWILSGSAACATRRLENLATAWAQPPATSKRSREELGAYYEHLLAKAAEYSMSMLAAAGKTCEQITRVRGGIRKYFQRGTDVVVAEAFRLIPLLGGFSCVSAALSGATDVAVALAICAVWPKAATADYAADTLQFGTWLGRLIGAVEGSIEWKRLAQVKPKAAVANANAAADAMDTDMAAAPFSFGDHSAARIFAKHSPAQCLRIC